uniref:Histone H4 n=1 Tax=Aquila chrysaetos chrysaetos TaxID=223781 RepID=A0A663DVM8_AQUCH
FNVRKTPPKCKAGKRLGKEGGKHCPVLRHCIQGTTKPACISGMIFSETRRVLVMFLENKETVTAMDAVYALRCQSRPCRTPRTNLVFLSGFWS